MISILLFELESSPLGDMRLPELFRVLRVAQENVKRLMVDSTEGKVLRELINIVFIERGLGYLSVICSSPEELILIFYHYLICDLLNFLLLKCRHSE